jgi:hypothetical protein
LEGVGEIVSSVTFDFNGGRSSEFNTESLGTLLEHTHEFFSIIKVVVHKDPIVEIGGLTDFILDISQIVSVL